MRPAEYELMNSIYEKIDGKVTGGTIDLIIGIEPELAHQTLLTIVGYNSEKPITYDIIDDYNGGNETTNQGNPGGRKKYH